MTDDKNIFRNEFYNYAVRLFNQPFGMAFIEPGEQKSYRLVKDTEQLVQLWNAHNFQPELTFTRGDKNPFLFLKDENND